MLLPAMMIVTARIINNIPQPILGVKVSPNTATPKNTAVTGSSAPSMAVGVEPIYWTALVVQREDGKRDQVSPKIPFGHNIKVFPESDTDKE